LQVAPRNYFSLFFSFRFCPYTRLSQLDRGEKKKRSHIITKQLQGSFNNKGLSVGSCRRDKLVRRISNCSMRLAVQSIVVCVPVTRLSPSFSLLAAALPASWTSLNRTLLVLTSSLSSPPDCVARGMGGEWMNVACEPRNQGVPTRCLPLRRAQGSPVGSGCSRASLP